MLNEIISSIRNLIGGIKPWILVSPWEQCLRVRFGKRIKLLFAGFHFRLPIFDRIYVQSIRTRISTIDRQTLTTSDGKVVTLAAQINYSIENVQKIYQTLHHAEETIRSMVRANTAQYVFERKLEDCEPNKMGKSVTEQINFDQYGIKVNSIQITDFAVTRAYRIMGDYGSGGHGGALDTETAQING